MSGLLDGLEGFGLDNVCKMKVYGDIEEKNKKSVEGEVKKEKTEEDYLFEKTYNCPVCDHEFKMSAVRTGKAKLIGTDTDLHPRYQGVDPLKYDAIVCPRCGYAALSRFFSAISFAQSKLVMEQISQRFSAHIKNDGIFTYDDAIMRYRLALANAMVKKSKVSERAYICLKTAWMIRSKAEETADEAEKKSLAEQEQEFLTTAYEGFNEATTKENYPICGMDEMTLFCMLGDVGRRIGRYEEAGRLISRVIVSKNAPDRVKNKAREIKELITKEMFETNKMK